MAIGMRNKIIYKRTAACIVYMLLNVKCNLNQYFFISMGNASNQNCPRLLPICIYLIQSLTVIKTIRKETLCIFQTVTANFKTDNSCFKYAQFVTSLLGSITRIPFLNVVEIGCQLHWLQTLIFGIQAQTYLSVTFSKVGKNRK